MYAGILPDQIEAAVEALLFVSDEPVSVLTLSQMIECDPAEIECSLTSLRRHLEEADRGVQLREVAGGWRLYSHPMFNELISKYVVSWDTRRLTQAAMEALAIIAYGQPVTRASVSAVRGVNTDSSINSLLDKGLICEVGVADAPGNPVLYGTSRAFLEKFGLRSAADLPPLETFAPDEATAELIRERLSATRVGDFDGEELDGEGGDLGTFEFVQPEDVEESKTFLGMHDAMAQAMFSALGAVEKVDLSALRFETDDDE